MDEIDLDKLIAESEKFQPENTGSTSAPQAPRLRKIKRPKHPGRPISANTMPQNPNMAQTSPITESNPFGTQSTSQPEQTPYGMPRAGSNSYGAPNAYGVDQTPYETQNVSAPSTGFSNTQVQGNAYQAQQASYSQESQAQNYSAAPQGYANPQGYAQPQTRQGYQSAGYEQPQTYMPADPNRELMRPNQQPVFDNAYAQQPPSLEDQTEEYDSYAYQPNSFLAQLDIKKLVALAVLCLCMGLFIGKFLFSSEQVVNNGLQGVVVNPEVPKGRSRCGVAEKSQGCVLYIMNPQRQDLSGRDFYDLASQLTGRQRFVIETGNMRYSTVKIKPGNIAQLNIPPLQ